MYAGGGRVHVLGPCSCATSRGRRDARWRLYRPGPTVGSFTQFVRPARRQYVVVDVIYVSRVTGQRVDSCPAAVKCTGITLRRRTMSL